MKIKKKIRTGPNFCWSGPVVRVFGPKIRTNLVRSGIPDHRTGPKIGWSGFPDHRTGPRLIGPEFRTIGPDQLYLVRNSGPPDRTNFTWSGIPDHRTGPKLNWSGIPDHSGPTRTNINLVRSGHPWAAGLHFIRISNNFLSLFANL